MYGQEQNSLLMPLHKITYELQITNVNINSIRQINFNVLAVPSVEASKLFTGHQK